MSLSKSDRGQSGRRVVVVGGLRTPFAPAGTALASVPGAELGRVPSEELLLKWGVSPEAVDEVIFGSTTEPVDFVNIARVIALRTGIPEGTPATTVRASCASGLRAVTTACDRIRLGHADVVLAGGVDSMSAIPFLFRGSTQRKLQALARAKSLAAKILSAAKLRPLDLKPVPGYAQTRADPVCGLTMGECVENLAREFNITRQAQDDFALESHHRALKAGVEGVFRDEIIAIHAPPDYRVVHEDVGPRKGQSLEALGALKPCFSGGFGTVTVGNSSASSDGGVALLLASEEKARALDVEPLGTVASYAYAGCSPARMGLGPVFACPIALDRAGCTLEEMDRIELNETFAAQVLASKIAFASREFARRELGRDAAVGELDLAKVNVNGGAIAFGHPVGASGARLVLTLLTELKRCNLGRGLVACSVGDGQGAAVVMERTT